MGTYLAQRLTAATWLICFSAFGAQPTSPVARERVDLIEINHFHDDQGRPVFDQILFYEWSTTENRYQVRDWRMLKNANQLPLSSWRDGEYVAVWTDFKNRDLLRTTQAKLIRETWTQFDPELVEREFLPESKRRKLREPTARLTKSPTVESASPGPAATTALRPLQRPLPSDATRN